jgi:tetraacyldisaccharide 4'-kinase
MTGLESLWYRNSAMQLVLRPISWLFAVLAEVRRLLYRTHLLKSYQLPVPVIVIGNISVGGTGKTPLTLALAAQLIEQGFHPVIITRGFGGNRISQQVTEHSTAAEVGDEPLLMAHRRLCPVWVGADRVAVAKQALLSCPDVDLILSDDGLQHYRLQRDVEIVVVDGVRGFGNAHLLPAGPLREPVSRLKLVDAVVVNGGEFTQSLCRNQYAMQLTGEVFYNLKQPDKIAHTADFKGQRLHAVAGIGNPARFFDDLKLKGLITINHAFSDHYAYQAEDLKFENYDALFMTEKDAVKCSAYADDKFWVLRVHALIPSALITYLLRKIKHDGC